MIFRLRYICLMVMILSMIPGFSACRSVPDAQTETMQARRLRITQESKELGEKLLKKYQANDAKGFSALLSADVRKHFGVKEFEATRKSISDTMGNIQTIEYLTKLQAPGYESHLWKVTFRREGVRAKDKEYDQETLFRILTSDLNGKPYLISFGFL